ncbi:hypothetical protein [Ekhidna sp.]|uniref:hypothetical protein n=1 Tax=Ekhidna sp. TaxID=2608089 RepID=UPI0032EC5658
MLNLSLNTYAHLVFMQHIKEPPKEVTLSNALKMKKFIAMELIIMSIIPLLAELMANGIDI